MPDIREHKAELIDLLTATVTVQTADAQCDMTVLHDRVIDFMTEAKRRGLIVRYRVEGNDTLSTLMPGPGQTVEAIHNQVVAELGSRVEIDT